MGVERDGQRGCEIPRRTERTCFFHNLAANVTYLMFHSISPSMWTTENLVDSAFLTHGDARAYHELLQGQGNANDSLAQS